MLTLNVPIHFKKKSWQNIWIVFVFISEAEIAVPVTPTRISSRIMSRVCLLNCVSYFSFVCSYFRKWIKFDKNYSKIKNKYTCRFTWNIKNGAHCFQREAGKVVIWKDLIPRTNETSSKVTEITNTKQPQKLVIKAETTSTSKTIARKSTSKDNISKQRKETPKIQESTEPEHV